LGTTTVASGVLAPTQTVDTIVSVMTSKPATAT